MSLLEELKEIQKPTQQEEDSLTGTEVLTEAVKNIPSSAAKLVTDVTYPIRHPIDTAQSLASLGRGVVKLIMPGEPTIYDEDEEAAKAVGKFFADRYGSFEGFKNSFATDPLGVFSDVAIVFTGGAGLAAKVPGVAGKTTQTVSKIGEVIDPVLGGAKLVGATAVGAGKVTAPLLGVTTGAGTDAIQVAARAGASSPEVQKMFLDNLRGDVAPEEIVPKAVQALKDRQTTTRGKFKKDKKTLQLERSPVNFKNVTQAIKSFEQGKKFGPVSELSVKAQKKLSDIKKIVKQWEKNPELHNAKGLDILKRRIDAEYPTGLNVGDSGVVVSEIRNLVKNQILDEVPDYGRVMKDYELAVNLEKQFMQELSIGKNKQAGTTLRKLQSALRNNVNTSYGNRLNMLEDLDPSLITEIGGQALSSVTPRGLQGLSASGFLGLGAFVNPASLLALPFQSPRLVGETAFKIGQLEKSLKPLQGQTALDIARGARLTGEVMRADDVDNAELLRLLLESQNKKEMIDKSDVNTIQTEALKLSEEFDKEEEKKSFAVGGSVNEENIAENILRKINMSFALNELQNPVLADKIAPLQRISKDADSVKFNDQVFAELEKYVKNLETSLKDERTIPLQRFKNVVDRAIENNIDDGFTQGDEDIQNQIAFAPRLYQSYLGITDTDEPYEATEKAANKILERVMNKNFTGEETANFLLAHNKLAPKDTVPLFFNKLESALSSNKFTKASQTLKDALKIKIVEVDGKGASSGSNELNKTLKENDAMLSSLFTNEELEDIKSFQNKVVPEVTKRISLNPSGAPFVLTSALAKSGLLGSQGTDMTSSSLDVAKRTIQNLQSPLVEIETQEEQGLPETQELMTDQEQINTQNELQKINVQQSIDNFMMPQMQQPVFVEPESDLTPPEMLSPTILPDEKDREIAMRQMGGLGSLV